MKLILIANIITCVCAFAGFIYGSITSFKPKKAVYPQMITLAVGCMAFGKLYQVVRVLTGGEIFGQFQLGVFGYIGSLMFLFSANFGAMDRLADDKSNTFRKYRIIAFAAPCAVAVLYALFIFSTELPIMAQVVSAVTTVLAMHASYYHLKHLIFPDVDYGVIKCLRPYNLSALIYISLCFAEMIVIGTGNEISILIIDILMGIILIDIIVLAERGIKKWKI